MGVLFDDFAAFVGDIQESNSYLSWARDNHGGSGYSIDNPKTGSELQKWVVFRTQLVQGTRPLPPAMTTALGKAMVDAGVLYLDSTAPGTPPPPPPAPPPAGSFGFGFSAHTTWHGDPDAYVARLAAAGATVLRDDFSWGWAETTKGSIDWSRCDLICGLAKKYGMRVIAHVGFAPGWANGGKSDKVGPTNPSDLGVYAKAFVQHVEGRWPGLLYGIEPWNEPDNAGFLTNPATGKKDPVYYGKLLNAVYDAVHPLGSTVKVIGGSTMNVGWNVWNEQVAGFTEAVLNSGVRFDEWSTHPYYWDDNLTGEQMTRIDLATGWSRVFWISSVETLAKQLARYGYTGPIHATECGAPTDRRDGSSVPRGTSEANQARWFELAWPMWKAQPRAGFMCVYTGQDTDSNDQTDPEKHFGSYRSDASAKPIVAKMKAAKAALAPVADAAVAATHERIEAVLAARPG